MSDSVKMVPYEKRSEWSPTQGQAIGYVRCEEVMEAGSGERRFRIVRTVEEAVSRNCVTEAAAWADVRDGRGERLLDDARGLLEELSTSREFLLYITPESRFGRRVEAWLKGVKA
jgi:hypothetical protein